MSTISSSITLDNLGEDILSRTLQYLPIQDILLNIRTICSSFQQATNIDALWLKRSIELITPLCIPTRTYYSSSSSLSSTLLSRDGIIDESSSYSSPSSSTSPTAYDIVLAHKIVFKLSSWYATFVLLAKYGPLEGLFRGIKTGSPRGFVSAMQTKATLIPTKQLSKTSSGGSTANDFPPSVVYSRSSSLLSTSSSSSSSLSNTVPSPSSSSFPLVTKYTVAPTVTTSRISRSLSAITSPSVSRTSTNDTMHNNISNNNSSTPVITTAMTNSMLPFSAIGMDDGVTIEMYEPAVGTLFPVPMGLNPPMVPPQNTTTTNNNQPPSATSAPPVPTKVRLHCFLHPRTGIPLRLVGVYLCPRDQTFLPILYNIKVNRGNVQQYMRDSTRSMLSASPQTFLFTRIPHEWFELFNKDNDEKGNETVPTLSNDLVLIFRRWLFSLLKSYAESIDTTHSLTTVSSSVLFKSPKNTSVHNRHTLMVNGWVPISFALERLPSFDIPSRAIHLMHSNPQYQYLRHIIPLIGLWRSIYSLHGAEYILITIEEMGERDPTIVSNDIHSHSSPYRILQELRNASLPHLNGDGHDTDDDDDDEEEDDDSDDNGNEEDDEYEFENYTDENEFRTATSAAVSQTTTVIGMDNSTIPSTNSITSHSLSSSSSSTLTSSTSSLTNSSGSIGTSNFAVTQDSINATLRASHDSYDLTMYYSEKSTSSSSSSSSTTSTTTTGGATASTTTPRNTFSVSAFSNLVTNSITSSILQGNNLVSETTDDSMKDQENTIDRFISHASSSLSSITASTIITDTVSALPYDPPLYPADIDIVPTRTEILPNVRSLPSENQTNENQGNHAEKKQMEETLRGLWRQIFNQNPNENPNSNASSSSNQDDNLLSMEENDLTIDIAAETAFFTKVMRSLRNREWQYSRDLSYARYNTFQISNTVETSTFWGTRSRKRLHPSQYGLCLMARKITGDQNVPSGQFTFQIHLEPESSVRPHDIVPPDAFVVSFEDRPSIRDIYSIPVLSAHRGRGQVNMSPEVWDPKTSKGFVFVRQPKPQSSISTTPKSPRTTNLSPMHNSNTNGSSYSGSTVTTADIPSTEQPLPELTFLWRHAGLETFLAHDFSRVYFAGAPREYFGPPVVNSTPAGSNSG